MQIRNVLHGARRSLKIQDAKKIAICAPSHNVVGCRAISAQLRQVSTIGKKLVKQQYTSATCPHNMVNFSSLMADIASGVWGTPANFNCFRVLAALLHGIYSSGCQPNFAAFNRGRHLCSAGRPSRLALAHILVLLIILTRLHIEIQFQACALLLFN